MSSTVRAQEKTVQERIDELVAKADRADDLYERVQRIEHHRQRSQNKNRGFAALTSKLDEIEEQYNQLASWVQYAGTLSIDVPEDELQDAVDTLSRDTRSVRESTYEDFDDRGDIDTVIEAFEDHRTTLRELTADVRGDVQDAVDEELTSVNRLRSLLQIPDIGSESDETVCEDYWYVLRQLEKANLKNTSPAAFADARDAFVDLDISLSGYGLSDQAEDVIWAILEDETVTLADIDTEVLEDLKTFEEFSNRLSVEFTDTQ